MHRRCLGIKCGYAECEARRAENGGGGALGKRRSPPARELGDRHKLPQRVSGQSPETGAKASHIMFSNGSVPRSKSRVC